MKNKIFSLVPIYKIRLHEAPEELRLKKLREQILSDGFLKCPLLVLPMETGEYFVIDGVHRFNSLLEAGCKKIPVQIVDVKKIILSTWAHEIPKSSWKQDMCLNSEFILRDELPVGASWIASIIDDKGKQSWFVPVNPSQDISEKLNYEHKIVNSYLGNVDIKRVASDIDELPPNGFIRFIYPEWSMKDIETAVELKAVLPPGTTRFILKNRLDNLYIPLDLLTGVSQHETTLDYLLMLKHYLYSAAAKSCNLAKTA